LHKIFRQKKRKRGSRLRKKKRRREESVDVKDKIKKLRIKRGTNYKALTFCM